MKNDKKTFNTLQAKIEDLKEDESDISESYGESQADSFFLLKYNYQGLEPKDNTAKHTILYNDRNKRSIHKKIDLRTVVLLDNDSTMDLF